MPGRGEAACEDESLKLSSMDRATFYRLEASTEAIPDCSIRPRNFKCLRAFSKMVRCNDLEGREASAEKEGDDSGDGPARRRRSRVESAGAADIEKTVSGCNAGISGRIRISARKVKRHTRFIRTKSSTAMRRGLMLIRPVPPLQFQHVSLTPIDSS